MSRFSGFLLLATLLHRSLHRRNGRAPDAVFQVGSAVERWVKRHHVAPLAHCQHCSGQAKMDTSLSSFE